MKKLFLYASLIACFAGLLTVSCKKAISYPDVPEITFDNLELWGDTVEIQGNRIKLSVLSFRIVDGDGDVGLVSENDTSRKTNLVIYFQQKVNGKFINGSYIDSLKYSTPYIEPGGLDKSLRGTVKVKFFRYYQFSNFDTVRYIYYIVDRANQKSNIDTTPPIPYKSKYIRITRN